MSLLTLSFILTGFLCVNTNHEIDFTGILIGTLTMEMGGKVSISCPKTSYRAEVEFKLKVRGKLATVTHNNTYCIKLTIKGQSQSFC